MNIRFLKSSEYQRTKALAAECFGSTSDLDDYYAHHIADCRIAAAESDGQIQSMIHLHRVFAHYEKETVPAWYLLYICTAEAERGKGIMGSVLQVVLETLRREGERFVFLVPVRPEIYTRFGFVHPWKFRPEERELLFADDGLEDCFACIPDGGQFTPPLSLSRADGLSAFQYRAFDATAAAEHYDFFHIRPNRSYDSVPLDCFLWKDAVQSEYTILDNRCLLLKSRSEAGFAGMLPFCPVAELPYYFRLEERYFNEVLRLPFLAFLQDAEGIAVLRNAGVLEHYEITEDPEIYDYLYDGDALRTLAGRSLAGKRNRINKFEREYGADWEYRSLGYSDREEILAFLKRWSSCKDTENGAGVSLGDCFDAAETLEIELTGTAQLLQSPELMQKVRAGGIYVGGVLCAFSLGAWNPRERMAVIEIEKALPGMDGLYQLINREFLRRAFPEANLVNREDDVGIPGLRKAKLSYHPIAFERRFTLRQTDFHHIF